MSGPLYFNDLLVLTVSLFELSTSHFFMFADIIPTVHQFPQQLENSSLKIVRNVVYHFGHCSNLYLMPGDVQRGMNVYRWEECICKFLDSNV